MKVYEAELGHKLDINALRRIIYGKYFYEELENGLKIRRRWNKKETYFSVYGDGKITVEADSMKSASTKVYDVIKWLKRNYFIILEDTPKVRKMEIKR